MSKTKRPEKKDLKAILTYFEGKYHSTPSGNMVGLADAVRTSLKIQNQACTEWEQYHRECVPSKDDLVMMIHQQITNKGLGPFNVDINQLATAIHTRLTKEPNE